MGVLGLGVPAFLQDARRSKQDTHAKMLDYTPTFISRIMLAVPEQCPQARAELRYGPSNLSPSPSPEQITI